MFKNHKIHSIFHKLCNHKHIELNDKFEILKLKDNLLCNLNFNYEKISKNIYMINFENTLKNIINHVIQKN